MRRCWILILVLLLLAACTATADLASEALTPVTATELDSSKWILIEYGPVDAQTDALPDTEDTAEFDNGIDFHGTAGCNSYGTTFTIEETALVTTEIQHTRFTCEDEAVAAQETAVFAALDTVHTIGRRGNMLVIQYGGGELRFMPEPQPPVTPLTGTAWRLTRITRDGMDEFIVPDWLTVTAVFAQGNVSGQGPCNSYGGPYRVDGETFTTSQLMMTQAGCPDAFLTELERALMAGWGTAVSYTLNADQLTINFNGGQLVFRPQTEAASHTPAAENAVYAALLRETFGPGDQQMLVREMTVFNAPGVSLDETLAAVTERLGEEILESTTVADFHAKNDASQSLSGFLDVPLPITVLSEVAADALAADWQSLFRQYPNTPAILAFSRVGFNEAGDQALVYYELVREDFTGGYYSLLILGDDGVWRVTRSFLLWP